jgi:Tol biopolymer transport system component
MTGSPILKVHMRAGIRGVIIGALLTIIPAACGVLDPEERGQEQILFISGVSGANDIHRMNADGSGVVNLTRSPDHYQSLDLTPEGRRVVFARQSDCQIVSMTPDGSDQKPLGDLCARLPRVSPNGRLVAYESDNAIHVMSIDGTGSREVSDGLPPVQPSPCGQTPNWHVWPFGWVSTNRVAFRRHICGVGTTFYSVNADGTGLVEIDFNPQTAHLSPDATRIAFDRICDVSAQRSVTVMDVDGSHRRVLAADGSLPDGFYSSRSPWSPNGSQLYFRRTDTHYVVDVANSATRRLAEPPTDAGFLGWSRQGDRMLFMVNERDQTGAVVSSDIHVVNADGTGMVNLTRNAAFDFEAVWVP